MNPDFNDRKILEKYSSAFTLSDMEIFIFPELFYPLILANIMSPILWRWRDDPWFRDIEKKSFTNRANRIKQFIIQNYVFNLDLSTWGLTSKTTELARFSDFFDMDMLRQSNALFGYEGDKYYFDIDIRKHFGLDKYNSDIIPYWKTETIEAMDAFRHKENFSTGAGECVSLSALYAAAMFVVGRVPLEEIFLIATPLHSQNFITGKEGLITNNRRIVTKNMWFNGTSISEKARRALENEKVTIVSHISGYIHTIYKEATISKSSYDLFTGYLKDFLRTDLTKLVFMNFLRFKSKYKCLFQYRFELSGIRYILLERMFEYEHSNKYNAFESRDLLLKEVDGDDFHMSPIQGKIVLNSFEKIIEDNPGKELSFYEKAFTEAAGPGCSYIIPEMMTELKDFVYTEPKLPEPDKRYIEIEKLAISTDDTREKIITKINKASKRIEPALLAQYVYREMESISWVPFIKASVERNPVSFSELDGKTVHEVYDIIMKMPDDSIYEGKRMALPDEVWNFRHGDGIEKSILLACYINHIKPGCEILIESEGRKVNLKSEDRSYHFTSKKAFNKTIRIADGKYFVEER